MDRDIIIDYLQQIMKIARIRYEQIPITEDWQERNKYFGVELQIKSLLKYEHQYDDEELLQEAMSYERIKPLPDYD